MKLNQKALKLAHQKFKQLKTKYKRLSNHLTVLWGKCIKWAYKTLKMASVLYKRTKTIIEDNKDSVSLKPTVNPITGSNVDWCSTHKWYKGHYTHGKITIVVTESGEFFTDIEELKTWAGY